MIKLLKGVNMDLLGISLGVFAMCVAVAFLTLLPALWLCPTTPLIVKVGITLVLGSGSFAVGSVGLLAFKEF